MPLAQGIERARDWPQPPQDGDTRLDVHLTKRRMYERATMPQRKPRLAIRAREHFDSARPRLGALLAQACGHPSNVGTQRIPGPRLFRDFEVVQAVRGRDDDAIELYAVGNRSVHERPKIPTPPNVKRTDGVPERRKRIHGARLAVSISVDDSDPCARPPHHREAFLPLDMLL